MRTSVVITRNLSRKKPDTDWFLSIFSFAVAASGDEQAGAAVNGGQKQEVDYQSLSC